MNDMVPFCFGPDRENRPSSAPPLPSDIVAHLDVPHREEVQPVPSSEYYITDDEILALWDCFLDPGNRMPGVTTYLLQQVERLRNAIKEHRAALPDRKGDSDDEKLYEHVGDGLAAEKRAMDLEDQRDYCTGEYD